MGSERRLRQNVGRIDHVVWFYSSSERLEDTRDKMTAVLGLTDDAWEKPVDLDAPFHLRTVLCWEAGLEIVCPTPGHEADWFGAPLIAERGEGIGMVIFGVGDMDAAARRAAAAGFPVIQSLEDSRNPPAPDSITTGLPFVFGAEIEAPFRLIREAVIMPFNSSGLALGQLEPLNPLT